MKVIAVFSLQYFNYVFMVLHLKQFFIFVFLQKI